MGNETFYWDRLTAKETLFTAHALAGSSGNRKSVIPSAIRVALSEFIYKALIILVIAMMFLNHNLQLMSTLA